MPLMLILDKQKAVEHLVALTTVSPEVAPQRPPARARGRARQKVATFEQAAPEAEMAQPPRRARTRAARPRTKMRPAPGATPA